ncbi:MAG: hypothetical protein U0835_04190 [Isosphaeraceae bacterium]
MGTETRSGALGRAPAGLLGMLVLVVAAEAAFARHEMDLKTAWFWEWRVIGRAAQQEAAESDVICFGDSLVNHGLLPPVLESRLGRPTYNLALSGGQSTTSYLQLRRVLEAGGKPSAVIVDFFPLLLNHTYRESTPRWPDLLTTRECLELAWEFQDPTFLTRTMLARAFVSVRVRDGCRTVVRAALTGDAEDRRAEALAWRRNWRRNRGSSVFQPVARPNLARDLDEWFREAFREPDWCAPYHAAYLRRFLDLAASRDIPVFWLVPPIHPEAQRRFDDGGIEIRYDRLLRSALARYPNLVVIDGRRSGYAGSVFVDQAHLDRRGASLLSHDVATIVARSLGGERPPQRWQPLPAFRPLALDEGIEDVSQSRRVVRAPDGIIRR